MTSIKEKKKCDFLYEENNFFDKTGHAIYLAQQVTFHSHAIKHASDQNYPFLQNSFWLEKNKLIK